MTTLAKQELHALIRAKLTDGMTADQAADAVAALFYRVEDEWESFDVSTMQHGPGTEYLDQRKLVAEMHVNDTRQRNRIPNRAVTS